VFFLYSFFQSSTCSRICRRGLLDQTSIWSRRHLMIVLREDEDFATPAYRTGHSGKPRRCAAPAPRRRHRPGPFPGFSDVTAPGRDP
jgi:hypothetical protein